LLYLWYGGGEFLKRSDIMQDFKDKKILLGVSGGIAAYKSAFLVRELLRLGAMVRVVMTASAQEFITPLTFQALSGEAVRLSLFDTEAERAMGHIELARWADYLLIAPATAHCLAKFAQGLADDLLSTLYLVTKAPVIVCPAMNHSMWMHPATISHCKVLQARGVTIVDPEEGSQACGEYGWGRLSEVDSILNVLRLETKGPILQGKKVLITAGATREAIDPVRYISNHSSGKMGYALAFAAQRAGAEVILVSGFSQVKPPSAMKVLMVETAASMYEAVMSYLEPGMIFIGCAAVADYSVENVGKQKLKKQDQKITLTLVKNPDIIQAVAESDKAALVVGFAAETENVLLHAKQKRAGKKLDMVIANQVGDGLVFDKEENSVTVVTEKNQIVFPKMHKMRLAGKLIALMATLLQNESQV
jgi:phosphopantothenoylcysteine decarboxylase/phosphopantothenate--cysteine ligase